MCVDLAATAKIFENKEEAIKFLEERGKYGEISEDSRKGLLSELDKSEQPWAKD